MKKRLLIAGGSYADEPNILAAKKMGFHVITSGNNPNDLGHLISDEVCLADFSDKEALLGVAKKIKIDAICASCNDFSAISSAYVAEKLGLPGHDSYETSILLHHKDKYRQFVKANGIVTPNAIGFANIEDAERSLEEFTFPIIVKPVDLTGGKGISKAHNFLEAKNAIRQAFNISKAKRIVIEDFIDGTRHGCSMFIQDKKIIFIFLDNEFYFLNPYLVSGTSVNFDIPEYVINLITQAAEKITSILELKDGIFHAQFILTGQKNGDLKTVIIEICRRTPGDLYPLFVNHSTGIDYGTSVINYMVGEKNLLEIKPIFSRFIIRHCIMASKNGIAKNLYISDTVSQYIIDKRIWFKPNEPVHNFLTQKFGIIFFNFPTLAMMTEVALRLTDLIYIQIE